MHEVSTGLRGAREVPTPARHVPLPQPVGSAAGSVVGPVHDPLEREAERLAGLLVPEHVRPSPGGTGTDLEVFGSRLGLDLSRVRVHSGTSAEAAAASVGAGAFTVGDQVVLGRSDRSGDAPGRRRLLAHELAHVAQHQQGRGRGAAGPVLRRQPLPGTADLERELLENERKSADRSLPQAELLRLGAERDALLARYRAAAGGGTAAPEPAGGAGAAPGPSAGPGAGPGAAPDAAARAGGEQVVPVGVTYEIVAPLAYAPPSGPGPGTDLDPDAAGEVLPYATGALSSAGLSTLRYVDPLPGSGAPGAPNVYTRFVHPGAGELRPRLDQAGDIGERIKGFEYFRRKGVQPGDLSRLAARLKAGGVGALTAEEAALLRVVTSAHAVENATAVSPLISLTELEPTAENLKLLPPVARSRTYVVRVRIDPKDVVRVNEILARTGKAGLAAEQEVLVALDLAAGAGPRGPEILSVTANQAEGAPLAGAVGKGLRFAGKALLVLGAALTTAEVVTARGPGRRETQGRAAGSFVGGTALAAFGTGVVVGLGVATGGVALVLIGLGLGVAGAVGGGAVGGRIGRAFD
ncbi:DUF4157 domain-containing protein [Streptomyces sp. NPDC089799]|uniref:eCIS core domain-containing protein n=1 Tax=Streptomyces sp. NPDC089799 TaxID=3155066 RepID=UPI003429D48F